MNRNAFHSHDNKRKNMLMEATIPFYVVDPNFTCKSVNILQIRPNQM